MSWGGGTTPAHRSCAPATPGDRAGRPGPNRPGLGADAPIVRVATPAEAVDVVFTVLGVPPTAPG